MDGIMSASSWGCELKYGHCYGRRRNTSQPLREAVSWNINSRPRDTRYFSQPLREAVSWNTNALRPLRKMLRQPLREAVSWNVYDYFPCKTLRSSASSWGCELKCLLPWATVWTNSQPLREAVSWNESVKKKLSDGNDVSLFVRLWVEIWTLLRTETEHQSASSWGCELKYKLSSPGYKIF